MRGQFGADWAQFQVRARDVDAIYKKDWESSKFNSLLKNLFNYTFIMRMVTKNDVIE
jgi:hypothetical protein